jgi:hypothetical protein
MLAAADARGSMVVPVPVYEERREGLSRRLSTRLPGNLSASGLARPTALGVERIGSRSKTRKRQQSSEKPRKIDASVKSMREDMRTRFGLMLFMIAVTVVALIMSVVYSLVHP